MCLGQEGHWNWGGGNRERRGGLWEAYLYFWQVWPVGNQGAPAGGRGWDRMTGGRREVRRVRSMGSIGDGSGSGQVRLPRRFCYRAGEEIGGLDLGNSKRRKVYGQPTRFSGPMMNLLVLICPQHPTKKHDVASTSLLHDYINNFIYTHH